MEATIDMGEIKEIRHVSVGCLNDIRSWIFLPLHIEVLASEDGLNFQKAGTLGREEIAQEIGTKELSSFYQTGSYDLKLSFKAITTRFIRVQAKNQARCPEGHTGVGGKAWLFVDEIVVE